MSRRMVSRRAALAAVIGSNLLWSGSYVAGKAALDDVPFVTLNALRFSIAALVLAPLLLRRAHTLPRHRAARLQLVAIAGFGFCGNKALEFIGLSLTTATDTALLITSESLVTLLLAVLVLHERLRRSTALALSLGGLGVYVLVEGGLVTPHLPTGRMAVGDALVVVSLALESAATICGAALLRTAPPLTVTAATITLSLLVWVPAEAAYAAVAGPPHLGAAAWAGVLYLAIATTCIAYAGWFWGLRRLSAQDVTPVLLVQPLAGTAIAVVVRGERPTAATLGGGLAILAGVAVVGAAGSRRGARPEPAAMLPETL